MIFARDYEELLSDTSKEFFVSAIRYVSDIGSWAKERKVGLSEPFQPMKLMAEGKGLVLFEQSEIPDDMLNDVIISLSVRWSLRDNISDPSKQLNTVKKRLAYCLLKECARTVGSLGGDELLEDEWAIKRLEKLGFFLE